MTSHQITRTFVNGMLMKHFTYLKKSFEFDFHNNFLITAINESP